MINRKFTIKILLLTALTLTYLSSQAQINMAPSDITTHVEYILVSMSTLPCVFKSSVP